MNFEVISFDPIQDLLGMLDIVAENVPDAGACGTGCKGSSCGACDKGCQS